MSDILHHGDATDDFLDDAAAADAAQPVAAGPAAPAAPGPASAAGQGPAAGAATATAAATLAPAAPPPDRSRRRWRYVVVGLVLVAAAVALLVKGIGGSLNYFQTVDQALHDQKLLAGKEFRLEGLVQPGSVRVDHRHDAPPVVSFIAEGTKGNKVSVVNYGNPPTLFKANLPVVVVGHFAGTNPTTGYRLFDSTQIIVDHTNVYKAKYPNRVRAPNGTTR